MFSQARKIIACFGGIEPLARALGRKDASSVHRWLAEKDVGGTGGLVPSSKIPAVLAAAERYCVCIPGEAWVP